MSQSAFAERSAKNGSAPKPGGFARVMPSIASFPPREAGRNVVDLGLDAGGPGAAALDGGLDDRALEDPDEAQGQGEQEDEADADTDEHACRGR